MELLWPIGIVGAPIALVMMIMELLGL